MTKPPAMPEPLGWYVVNNIGMATLCADKQDATQVAVENSIQWPNLAPHRAMQLCDAGALQSAQPAEVSDAEIDAAWDAVIRAHDRIKVGQAVIKTVRAILALRPQAVPMAPRMVELLADVVPVENHDDNGPGSVTCPACDAYMHMRWKAGERVDRIEDLAHDAECPAVWARGITAQAKKDGA